MHADVRTGPLEGERRGRRKAETVAIDSGPLRIVLHSNTSGQITDKIEMLGGLRTHWRYVYDVDGRLWGSLLNGQPAEAYQYDAATGARVLETSEARGVAEREYAYGPGLRLLRAGDTFFEYDEDGRMTARIRRGPAGDVVERFHYDAQGRLSRVVLPGGETLEYDHDGQGRLRCRTVDGMASKEYEWDGPLRLSSFFNGAYHRFEYGQGRMPEAMVVNGRKRYSLGFDQVGSLRAVADERGHLVKIVAYDSWGNVLHDSNPNLEVPFGFAGGIRDEDTGLVRFLHRDYDPTVARWTAPDPIGPFGGDVDEYGYCLDDPIGGIDPTGLFMFSLPLAFLGGKLLGAGIAAAGTYIASKAIGDPVAVKTKDGKEKRVSEVTTDMVAKTVPLTLMETGVLGGVTGMKSMKDAGDFTTSTLPGPPAAGQAGASGGLLGWGYNWGKESLEELKSYKKGNVK